MVYHRLQEGSNSLVRPQAPKGWGLKGFLALTLHLMLLFPTEFSELPRVNLLSYAA